MSSRSILEHFETLPDPRISRCRLHPLHTILTIILCAMLCGIEDIEGMQEWAEDKWEWLRERCDLTNGIPSHDTLGRTLARLDPKTFADCFRAWVQDLKEPLEQEIIAVDGKTLRHSFDTKRGQSAIHMVSALATKSRLILGQIKVADKSNEITAVPELLKMLDLAGCIVTTDAMSCQKAIARQIVEQGGDYLLALKGNHPHLEEDVAALFTHQEGLRVDGIPLHKAETLERNRTRLETRTATAIALSDLHGTWSDIEEEWSGLCSLLRIHRRREYQGKVSEETCYFLSSLPADAPNLLGVSRAHWGIENSVHWVLDVAFLEDQCRTRKDHAPANLATVRHIALNLLRTEETVTLGIRNKRLKASRSDKYLECLLKKL